MTWVEEVEELIIAKVIPVVIILFIIFMIFNLLDSILIDFMKQYEVSDWRVCKLEYIDNIEECAHWDFEKKYDALVFAAKKGKIECIDEDAQIIWVD